MDDGAPVRQDRDINRQEKLRQKHPDTTGIYRRPGPDEAKPHPTLEDMLDLWQRRVRETLANPAASPEARANARETRDDIRELRRLLALAEEVQLQRLRLPASLARDLHTFVHNVATVAAATGTMGERLFVRLREDAALHGLEVAAARAKGGEATGGARRADALDWRTRARPLEGVWRRHPDCSASRVAKAIEARSGSPTAAHQAAKIVDGMLCIPSTDPCNAPRQ